MKPEQLTQDEILKEVGAEVRKARKRAGLSQRDLAAIIGTDKQYISSIENGRQSLSFQRLALIANAMGCNAKIRLTLQ